MIRVIRTDGMEILLNTDQVHSVDPGNPTTVIMTDGERVEVKNNAQDIWEKIHAAKIGHDEEIKKYRELEEPGETEEPPEKKTRPEKPKRPDKFRRPQRSEPRKKKDRSF